MILGVNIGYDREALAKLFVKMFKIPYLMGRDASGNIAQLYQVNATPTSVFIDKRGRVVDRVEGELEPSDLSRRIEALLR